MKCTICGDIMVGENRRVIVLEDGIAHQSCVKDRQSKELEKEFPDADKYFIRNLNEVNVEQFRSSKYCLQVLESDLDDSSCNGAYVSLEFFDTEVELNEYLKNSVFNNSEYVHRWVDVFHVNQKKEEFKFGIFFGSIENTEEYMDLRDQLDVEKDYMQLMKEGGMLSKEEVDINNLIWKLDTPKVQELLDEIVNSHHFSHLRFEA